MEVEAKSEKDLYNFLDEIKVDSANIRYAGRKSSKTKKIIKKIIHKIIKKIIKKRFNKINLSTTFSNNSINYRKTRLFRTSNNTNNLTTFQIKICDNGISSKNLW